MLLSGVTAAADPQSAEICVVPVVEVPGPTVGHGDDVEATVPEHGGDCCCADCAGAGGAHSLPLPEPTGSATGDFDGAGAVTDLSRTFELHSNPGARHTIYLDFDGHVTSGTAWNTGYNGGNDITTPAYGFEGDASFTDSELARIQRIWQRVAEDILPFDVDVTTEDPGADALARSSDGDTAWGIRVVIGGAGAWFGPAGGVAYVGSFNWGSDTPVFVFEDNLANGNEKFTAEAASHEAGHALGLSHDGGPATQYYAGHGAGETGWGTIMGVSYDKSLTQWSRGEYAGATNRQDDLSIITTQNGFGYRADDHGNSAGTAGGFDVIGNNVVATGIIERNTDVDVFSFTTGAGAVAFTATPAARGPNLDILLQLYDSNGQLVASANPADALNAHLSAVVAAGSYFLHVSGAGQGDPLGTGYSDYGSLGFYAVSGTIVSAGSPDTTGPRVIGSSSSGVAAGTIDRFTLTFSEPVAELTFTPADVSLTGPGGAAIPTTVVRISGTQYEVRFAAQSASGTYTLTVGPQITDSAGNRMDQDQDGIPGEVTQDRYVTTAMLVASDSGLRFDFGNATSPVESGFRQVTGNMIYNQATGYGWFRRGLVTQDQAVGDDLTRDFAAARYSRFAVDLENGTWDVALTFGDALAARERMGVNIEGVWREMDVSTAAGEFTTRTFRVEVTDGQLLLLLRDFGGSTREFAVNALQVTPVGVHDTSGPRIVSSAASGASPGTLDRFTLTFSEPIAGGSFTLADVSLAGPNGAIAPSAVTRLSGTQYEVRFAPQSAAGTYVLSVGPQITDEAGNTMDQDQDGDPGEAVQDRYTASSTLPPSQPAGAERSFDFGTAASPVAEGFSPVSRATRYDPARGFGWLAGQAADNDARSGDALTRDYNYTRDATFGVDLPNGTYDVTITLGDARHARDLMGVSLEGAQVASVSTAAGEFVTRTWRVVVSDGQLSLRLQDLGGRDGYVAINSMEIVAV